MKAKIACLAAAAALAAVRPVSAEPAREGFYYVPSGARVPFEPTYEGWLGSGRYQPNYARAVVENGILLLLELGVYWFDPDLNIVDWQFPDVGAKLTSREAFRFDDNLMQTNYLFHSFAGASHYVFTRTNGLGVLGSFGAAALSSALYELVFEWKELVSFNDLIVTPLGGTAMGEFFYHLGDYLSSEQPRPRLEVLPESGSFARSSARTVLAIPRGLNSALDEPKKPPLVARDELGLSTAYAHRFRVLVGQDSFGNELGDVGETFSLDGEFELAAMPGFLRPGRFQRWFTQGNFTSFELRLALGAQGGRDSELCFDSHLFGWYTIPRQDLRGPRKFLDRSGRMGSGPRSRGVGAEPRL